MRDVSDEITALRRRHAEAGAYLKVDELRARRPQLETEASRPDLWDDADKARQVTGELSAVTDDLDRYDSLGQRIDDVEVLAELAREEHDDSVAQEIEEALRGLAADFADLELRSLFTGEHDELDAICEVQSGEGGADAQDFANMLLRMYLRW
ncbi:MAG TPA: PCRF domain-containing protein, partial [Aquihabitans sp.]|nr:PCRF domain-containing protein [Aquihabitans sp.]